MTVSGMFRWFAGWVRVEAEGGYPEKLLNEVARQQLAVWGIRRKEESTRFCCSCRDYRYLRRPARRACTRMRIHRKHGLPFILHRYRHRKGLLLGAALYIAVLCLLSPRIWVVQVEGCSVTDAAVVAEQASTIGVRVGALMEDIDIKSLEINGTSHLPDYSFITVNPSGCVARIQVAERKPTPQVLDLSVPSDMVAVRDGVILSQRVVSGESRVLVGEAVRAGTVLIGGRVEKEVGEQLYRSYGEVWAETQRQITVSIPLTYRQVQTDAPAVLRPTVTFLGWQFPLYAPGQVEEKALRYTRRHFLTAGDKTLPLGITNDYYVPVRYGTGTRTQEQAQLLAVQQLEREEQSLFAGCEYTAQDRQEYVKGDAYTLTVRYVCRENIAVEVPLATN